MSKMEERQVFIDHFKSVVNNDQSFILVTILEDRDLNIRGICNNHDRLEAGLVLISEQLDDIKDYDKRNKLIELIIEGFRKQMIETSN